MSKHVHDPLWKKIRASLQDGPGFFAQDLEYLTPSFDRIKDGAAFYEVSFFVPPDDGQTYFKAMFEVRLGDLAPALLLNESDDVFKKFDEDGIKSIQDKVDFIVDDANERIADEG